MRGKSVIARLRGGLAAGVAACLLLTLSACATSYAGIPLKPGAAPTDLQDLARRAQAGDKHAQLELGIRYEEGRGVKPDPERAKRIYLGIIQPRSSIQTVYIPSDGSVSPENTVIGNANFWPASLNDIAQYNPARLWAVIRFCRLASEQDKDICGRQAYLLSDLTRLEGNFKKCRISSRLGNAGHNPQSFIINSVDSARSKSVRNCVFQEDSPLISDKDTTVLVWTTWLVLAHYDLCKDISTCLNDVTLSGEIDLVKMNRREDSLLAFAFQDFLGESAERDHEVGRVWWRSWCGVFRARHSDIRARDSEAKICNWLNLN